MVVKMYYDREISKFNLDLKLKLMVKPIYNFLITIYIRDICLYYRLKLSFIIYVCKILFMGINISLNHIQISR